jgi:hypothetical protein
MRVVAFPALIVPDVRKHLEWLPSSAPLVFASSTGSPLAHSNFRRRVWLPALAAVGLEGARQRALADVAGKAASAELAKSTPRKTAKPWGTRRARTRRATGEDDK